MGNVGSHAGLIAGGRTSGKSVCIAFPARTSHHISGAPILCEIMSTREASGAFTAFAAHLTAHATETTNSPGVGCALVTVQNATIPTRRREAVLRMMTRLASTACFVSRPA